MKNQSIIYISFFTIWSLFFSGCGRNLIEVPDDFLQLSPNATNTQNKTVLKIASMQPTDVIVRVNESVLTKEAYEKIMLFKAKSLSHKKGMNQYVMEKELDSFRHTYVKMFVAQRLLTDAAFAENIVTTNEVKQFVAETIDRRACATGRSSVEYLKSKGEEARFLIYELAVAYIMDKYVAKRIPPKAEVTPEFIAEVRKQVKLANAEATATNNLIKARLAAWRMQIVSQNEDFLKIAQAVSDPCLDSPSDESGVWGEFEMADLQPQELALAVFSLPLNGISEVLEDDNGYHVIKVLSITPPVKDVGGKTIESEKRKLSHIYLEKSPLLIEESDFILTNDMKRQMQMQAVSEVVDLLSTNGINKISYPHGLLLF